jgi:hypothetical protein
MTAGDTAGVGKAGDCALRTSTTPPVSAAPMAMPIKVWRS